MNSIVVRCFPFFRALIFIGAAFSACSSAAAQSTAADGEFNYHAQRGDTLIGLSKRLLLQPQRWQELQKRNRITEPRRIDPGSIIRIPYAWLRMSAESAAATTITGSVLRAGKPIAQGEQLQQGAVIETGADGSVTINLADGSIVTLQKASVLKLEQMQRVNGLGIDAAHSVRLKLESGRIETKVKPHRDVGRFEIATPVAVSAVRGTEFRASFSADNNNATTETLEGSVGVAGSVAIKPDAAVTVPAGFGTHIEADGVPLQPIPLLPPPDISAVPSINSQANLRVTLQPVANAKTYRVQLASDADFRSITFDAQAADLTVSIPSIAEGDHWLRARAIDGFGIEGTDAIKQVTQHVLPNPPALLLPKTGAKVVGDVATFEWNALERNATAQNASYRLQVARDLEFSSIVVDRQTADTTQVTIESLPANRYFWRVATLNAQGELGAWSATQTYTQQLSPPVSETPIIENRQMIFRWSARPVAAYRVQIANDLEFHRVLVDTKRDTATMTTKKPFPGVYYVRIQTVNTDGTADAFGPALRFDVPFPGWAKIALPLITLLPFLL